VRPSDLPNLQVGKVFDCPWTTDVGPEGTASWVNGFVQEIRFAGKTTKARVQYARFSNPAEAREALNFHVHDVAEIFTGDPWDEKSRVSPADEVWYGANGAVASRCGRVCVLVSSRGSAVDERHSTTLGLVTRVMERSCAVEPLQPEADVPGYRKNERLSIHIDSYPEYFRDPNRQWLALYNDSGMSIRRTAPILEGAQQLLVEPVHSTGGELLVCWAKGHTYRPWSYTTSANSDIHLPGDAEIDIAAAQLRASHILVENVKERGEYAYIRFYYGGRSRLPWWQVELPVAAPGHPYSLEFDLDMVPGTYRVRLAKTDGSTEVSLGNLSIRDEAGGTYRLSVPPNEFSR
jgi:hypothetical protein